jgi:endonuclease/exonuclease/phosphatase family metal-dependent hydrolase
MMSAVSYKKETSHVSRFSQPTYASWRFQLHGETRRRGRKLSNDFFDIAPKLTAHKSKTTFLVHGNMYSPLKSSLPKTTENSLRFHTIVMPTRTETRSVPALSGNHISLPVWPSYQIVKQTKTKVLTTHHVENTTSQQPGAQNRLPLQTEYVVVDQQTQMESCMMSATTQVHTNNKQLLPNDTQFLHRHVRVKTYNIMRDFMHFHSSDDLSWDKREKKILNVIASADADVVCLQECINLPHFPIVNFLVKLEMLGYDYIEFYDRSGINSKILRVVTAWKRGVFKSIVEKTMWLSPDESNPTPAYSWSQRVARPVGLVCLKNTKTATVFWVANTHLGHATRERVNSMKLLPWLLEKHTQNVAHCDTANHYPLILAGDFNIYEAGEAASHAIRNYVCNGHPTYKMCDIGVLATPHRPYVRDCTSGNDKLADQTVSPTGKASNSSGTFVGTRGDPWAPALGHVGSALDGIFVYAGSVVRDLSRSGSPHSWVWNYTGSECEPLGLLQQRNVFPSDHIGLVADIDLHN